ncbi:MAG: tripartite tricarboxylate transporter substrate binding protein [Alphaproteobacteria bacterium]|nr:tripartite tricarboxylate transporter substrate binding protein [Alphaproteobacteria bacterium]
MRGNILPLLAVAAGLALLPHGAAAQKYPEKTVTIVVPIGAGGAMDRITRLMAEQLSKRLGEPVIVENRPGAGMAIGATAVANAPADGHTLMNAPSGAYAINPTLFKKLPYDPEKDFVPVTLYARIPFVLVVHPDFPAKTVKDLIQYSKDNPGKLAYAASGRGGVIHLAGEMFRHAAKLDMTSVPYRQGGPASLNDVVAGHVPVTFADPAIVQGLIAGGKVRALGVTSRERMANLPNVPTLDEAGVPGFEAISWHMIVAPSKTPKPVIDRLHTELKAVAVMPAINQQMLRMGLMPMTSPSVADMQKFMQTENARWGNIVREAGVAGSM